MERMLEATARAEDRHFWFLGLRRTARFLLDRALAGRTVARIVDCGTGTGRNLEFDVLYCLDDETEAQALREMYRILRPGGIVLVNVAALDILRGSHSALTHEIRRYTPARLRARLATAGFTIERLTFTNLTAFLPALAIRGVERLTGRAAEASESDLAVPSAPVNALMDAALRVEAGWLRVANLPIGTSVIAVARKPAV
jgi:hypothetical protein